MPTFVFEISTPLSMTPGASWKVPLKVRGERQLLEGLPLGDLRDLRRLRVDERRGRRDGHLFGRRGAEHRLDLGVLRHADDDLLLEGAQARQLRLAAGSCRAGG